MHRYGRFERMVGATASCPHFHSVIGLLDPLDRTGEADVDPRAPRLVKEPLDEIAIKLRKRSIVFVQDGHLGSRSSMKSSLVRRCSTPQG
jgi:hypothetical protein